MSTYQALVFERIENASYKKPHGPQELKTELEHEIDDNDQGPNHQEFPIHKCAAAKSQRQVENVRQTSHNIHVSQAHLV